MSYLIIDNGTSHCRAAVVSREGDILSLSEAPIHLNMREPSLVEVDSDHVWDQVCRVIRAEVAKHPGTRFEVIGVSSMWGYVFLDEADRPLLPSIIWMDNRAGTETEEILRRFTADALYEKTGRRATPELLAPKLRWIFKHAPEMSVRIRKIIGLKDEIVRRLTGNIQTDFAHLDYSLLFNIRKGELDEDILNVLDIDGSLFPAPGHATDIAGAIHAEAARATGLKAGTPVIVGSTDGTTAMYGGGVLEEGKAVLVSGTTDVLMMSSTSPTRDSTHTLSINTGMTPGVFLIGGSMGMSGGTLQQMAKLLRESVEPLQEKITALKPGAGGLLFFPGLSGERAPYWKDHFTGSIVGLTVQHRAEHIFRAIMEGTSFRILKLLQILDENGLTPKSVNVVGGCARMDTWNQIRADVTGLEVVKLPVTEATILGTALFCKVGVGASGSLAEAAREWISAGKKYIPQRNAVTQYKRMFRLFDSYVRATEEIYLGLKELIYKTERIERDRDTRKERDDRQG